MAGKYQQVAAGLSVATLYPCLDFETYSEAGHYWDPAARRWRGVLPNKRGLKAVGAPAYAEHPSTEILSAAYDLRDGRGARLWLPHEPAPEDLLAHVRAGEPLEAHNVMFERLIWHCVAVRRLGWPALDPGQLYCSAAKCRRFNLPGALGPAGEAARVDVPKDAEGHRVMLQVTQPRNPTKKDDALRYTPERHLDRFIKLYSYNATDIRAEHALSRITPDLSAEERRLWLADQAINWRGVAIDRDALEACRSVVSRANAEGAAQIQHLTGGVVKSHTELEAIKAWAGSRGVGVRSLAEDTLADWLAVDWLPDDVRAVLQLRQDFAYGSASKLETIAATLSGDNRLRGLYIYCGADRTGRFSGQGAQPQNLPSGGPVKPWGPDHVEEALALIRYGDLQAIRDRYGSVLATVSGCLRGLFVAGPGRELICSDYTSIEAVVLAGLAGETWRLEAFRRDEDIYLLSASTLTGITYAEYKRYAQEHGEDHPHRKKLGKVAELASGFGGSVGAWKAFGADEFFSSDDDIKRAVYTWRDANPMIVELWRSLESAAHAAVRSPGQCYRYRDIIYGVFGDVLYCQLPSGRFLHYWRPRLSLEWMPWGKQATVLTFEGWNTNPKNGPYGWVRLQTHGGKLAENVTQAAARDIFAAGLVRLEDAGYPVVLHTHDEPCSEVPTGAGSIEEYEALMCQPLPWCADWPIKAAGGWRGHRYRKD